MWGGGSGVSGRQLALLCPFHIQSAACVLWPAATLLTAKSLINDCNFFRETKSFLVNRQVYKLKNVINFNLIETVYVLFNI